MFIKDFKGLNLQRNSFGDLAGYCEVAENVLVSRDNIIQKRNGYSLFVEAPTATPLFLEDYKNVLALVGSSYVKILNQDSNGDYTSTTSLTGQTFTVTYPRSVQAAGNCYITANEFLLKMESASATLLQAGVPKAPDLTYYTLGSGTTRSPLTGIHTPDTQRGYRLIFGRRDLNSNVNLGAPSELTQNTNVLLSASSVSLASYVVTINYTSHGLVTNDFVTIRNSNGTVAVPDGEYVATRITDNQFTINTAAVLSSAPSGVTALDFGIRNAPKLVFTLPSGVDTTYFWRLYRTDASISNDVEPDESTLQLIEELNVTSANISAGYIEYTDSVDDLFKTTYLYTNPNTGEGIAEANFQPPVARDAAVFKNHMFLAYPTTFYSYELSLIRSAAATFTNGDYVDILQTSNSKSATAAVWQSGTTVRYSISNVTNLQTGQYVLFTGFANSANNGKFIITAVSVTYIECTNAGRTDATLDESSVTSATCYPIRRYTAASSVSYNTALGGNFLLQTSSSSVASNIDATARSLCTTVNRDTYANCYLSYTSSSQSLPGQMFAYGRINTDVFAFQASSSTVGSNFDPVLPNTVIDLSEIATNSVYPNGLYISKQEEYEAFPLTSFLLIGSKDAAILRIKPLKNSLIIIKEDGFFSLRGSSRGDFSVIPLDLSVSCNAVESVQDLNGAIYCSSLDGVVMVSETNVAIVSREIEPLLTNIFPDADFATNTYSTKVDDERLYMLTTITPNNGEATTYVYNVLTNVWTTSDKLYKSGIVKRSDNTHYAITTDDTIIKMRKRATKLDFCDESGTTILISGVAADNRSCSVISPLTLTAGDVLVWDDTINRITNVSGAVCTFANNINFTASDLPVHYKAIVSSIKTSPLGYTEDTLQQFSELSLHFRNQSCSKIDIGFVSDANEVTNAEWTNSAIVGGWGELPWGGFEWGLSETSTIELGTYSAEPVRIFVPIECQVSTWIQTKLEHRQAAESINLQGMGLTVRKISTRVSR